MDDREGPAGAGGGKKPDENRSGRDGKGRFARGNRVNPRGRPKGSRNGTTLLVEELLANEAETLTRALIKRAKAGNSAALNLVFARLAPAPRDRPLRIDLPATDGISGLAAAHAALVRQVGAGALGPSEASAVAQLLELQRRALEAIDLEARLAAIEARMTARQEKP
jgi:hypothetical protein